MSTGTCPAGSTTATGSRAATVERLAARGTGLLVTVDCAITAVEEVAAARAAGVDVVVTDHHAPRADGALPDAPIVHPAVGGYPCPRAVRGRCRAPARPCTARRCRLDPADADADLDLVALATVADCVPLVDENRRLVREGLRALASTRKPGLQALMQVARVDPSGIDAGAIGFRLAPRINAAGRLQRADAGLELLLTVDVARARAVAAELDSVNVERRDVETRILFEAEKLVAESPAGAAAYVLAAEGWHPGVIGIVASRIAERHHRPAVLIALDGEQGTGSGRSIPAFDLLGGLQAASGELLRHGGHRAAAGLTIARGRVDAFRAAFVEHAAATLTPDDLSRSSASTRSCPGMRCTSPWPRSWTASRRSGSATLSPPCSCPARCWRIRGRWGRGATSRSRSPPAARDRAASPSAAAARCRRRPASPSTRPSGWRSTATTEPSSRGCCCVTPSPRLGGRSTSSASPASGMLCGRSSSASSTRGRVPVARFGDDLRGMGDGLGRLGRRVVRDVRGSGIAGLLGDLVHSGAPVLAVAANAAHRAAALRDRVGGFAVTSWAALEADPPLASGYAHVVAIDPPAHPHLRALAEQLPGEGWIHLAWGDAELELARRVLVWELDLRVQLPDAYRALRAASAPGVEGATLRRAWRPR